MGLGALGLSGATVDRLHVWIDDWQAWQAGEDFHWQAGDQGLGLDLLLTPLQPPALHGEGGFSPKAAHDEAASYYYFIPRLDTQGHLFLDGHGLEVSGASWMDHEFFSSSMAPGQVGWALVRPPVGGRPLGDALSPAPAGRLAGPGLRGHPGGPAGTDAALAAGRLPG